MRVKKPLPWTKHTTIGAAKAALQVNLSTLSAEKRRPVWERIKHHSPETAELLSDPDFKQGIANLEAVFGPVEICVDLDVLGEDK